MSEEKKREKLGAGLKHRGNSTQNSSQLPQFPQLLVGCLRALGLTNLPLFFPQSGYSSHLG